MDSALFGLPILNMLYKQIRVQLRARAETNIQTVQVVWEQGNG